MSKKTTIIIAIVLLCIISIISIYGTIISNRQKKEVKNYMNYINSDEVGSELKTPDLMHVVLAAYKGEAKGLTILKSVMYFKNNLIPDIQKNCGNRLFANIYYRRHSKQLYNEFGINNKEEFYVLVDKCNQLGDVNKLKTIGFNTDSIKRVNDGLYVELKMKTDGNSEVTFNVRILNKVYSDKASVIIK